MLNGSMMEYVADFQSGTNSDYMSRSAVGKNGKQDEKHIWYCYCLACIVHQILACASHKIWPFRFLSQHLFRIRDRSCGFWALFCGFVGRASVHVFLQRFHNLTVQTTAFAEQYHNFNFFVRLTYPWHEQRDCSTWLWVCVWIAC